MFTSILTFLSDIATTIIDTLGYGGVFLAMAIESACIPLPSEFIMPFAGSLATSNFDLVVVGTIGALGNLGGSLLAYWVGAREGRPLVEKYGKYILISRHDLNMADRWFHKHGDSTVFFTRMLPVVRTFISFPAGMTRMRLSTFCIYTFLGALPWSIGLAYVGMKMGQNRELLSEYFHKADILVGIVLIGGAVWYVQRHIKHVRMDRLAAEAERAQQMAEMADQES